MQDQRFNTQKSINALILDWISELDIRPNSARVYKNTLAGFVIWMTCNCVDRLSPKRYEILKYKEYLINSGKSSLTVDLYLSCLSLFFKYLEKGGYYPNIAGQIKSTRKYKGHRKGHLTESEVKILLNSIPRDTVIGMRNFAIVNLMVRTGIRCVEVSRLNQIDIKSVDTSYILRLQRKGSIEINAEFGATARVVAPIFAYLNECAVLQPGPSLFSNHGSHRSQQRMTPNEIGRVVTNALKVAGLKRKDITPHSLRHTAAVLAHKAGVGLLDISIMMGHSDASTTLIYTSSAKDAILAANPAVAALDSIFD